MITIKNDPNCEMMEIFKDDKLVFIGNYWDFSGTPLGISQFLINIGIENTVVEYSYGDECRVFLRR